MRLPNFKKKNGLITYSDPAAKLGVDVSEHQENIDWGAGEGGWR